VKVWLPVHTVGLFFVCVACSGLFFYLAAHTGNDIMDTCLAFFCIWNRHERRFVNRQKEGGMRIIYDWALILW